jgi:hypothetical protein
MSRQPALRLALWAAVLGLTGCAQRGPAPLYLWENFARQQYEVLLGNGVAQSDQILALQAHVEKARATNAALPPGLRAHLGLLQLNAGNPGQARDLWAAERQAFPESAPYMDQMLKRLDGQTPAAAKENPA